MKRLNLFLILTVLVISGKLSAQGMMPPDPIKSPLLESMMGTWVSNPYEMMGERMTDEVTQSMIMNGQFMQINVKSTGANGFVSLKVYNSLGIEVAVLVNESKPAGRYTAVFDGSNLSSGIYFYKLEAGDFTETKSMILLK